MKKIITHSKNYLAKWGWGLTTLTALASLLVCGTLLWLGIWLLETFFGFLALKFDLIITVCGVVVVVIYMWNTRHDEKNRQIKIAETKAQAQAAEIERSIAENNYTIIRQCLFTVLTEKADVIGLVNPSTLSDMNSPSRILPHNDFMLCQFVAMKKGSEVDLKLIKDCIQMRITQKLNAGEFEQLSVRTHVYNGRIYPALYLHEAVDTGGYIQLNMVLVNDAFCKHLETRAYAQYQNTVQPVGLPRDTDF